MSRSLYLWRHKIDKKDTLLLYGQQNGANGIYDCARIK